MKKALLLLLIIYFLKDGYSQVHFSQGFQRPQTSDSQGNTNIWKDVKTDSQGNVYYLANLVAAQAFNSQTYTPPANKQARMLVKYNAQGQVQWVKTTGSIDGDIGVALVLDADENPVVAGSIYTGGNYRLAVTKYSKVNGDVLLHDQATTGSATVRALTITPNGNLYMVATYFSYNENITWDDISNYWESSGSHSVIIKLDNTFTARSIMRAKKATGVNLIGEVVAITAANDNELYLAGNNSETSNQGLFYSRIDSLGVPQWFVKTGSYSTNDYAYSIDYHQGAVYGTGRVGGNSTIDFGIGSPSLQNYIRSFVVKLTPQGTAEWVRLNETSASNFELLKVEGTAGGDIIVYGSMNSQNMPFAGASFSSSTYFGFPQIDAVLFRLDTAGALTGYFHTEGNSTKPHVMASAPDNSIWIGGHYRGSINAGTETLQQYGGSNDHNFFVIHVTPGILTSEEENSIVSREINVYPNPSKGRLQILGSPEIRAAELIDISGRIILREVNSRDFDVSSVPDGIYILKLDTKSGVVNKKLIIEKN